MAGNALGAQKAAAARVGLSLAAYQAKLAAAEKWCTGCKAWHLRTEFDVDKSRADGLFAKCRAARRRDHRETYIRRPRPKAGRRYVEPRDNDRLQARGRVNHLVNVGVLPDPNDVPCTDCGHIWSVGESRHEYDHHCGYAADHHEDVQAVCSKCHHARERARRAAA